MREVRCESRRNEVVYAFRVHPLYVWWLRAVALWTVLRSVRIEVRWPWRRGR